MTSLRWLSRAGLALAAQLLLAGVTARQAEAIPLLNGLGGPEGYGTNLVHPNDDGSWAGPTGTEFGAAVAIDITPAFPSGLSFFGAVYRTMYVNNNGNITFRGGLGTYTPAPFPIADQPMIAPWWGDVDTRPRAATTRMGNNTVWWHVERNRIVVTWHNVGYFSNHTDQLNDFQLILTTSNTCTSTGDFDVEFRYNRCTWVTGDASGGTMGHGGTPAQVGFDAGNRRDFVSLPMSRTERIVDVCTSSNVPGGAAGLWRFQIRGGGVATGCMGGGTACRVPGLIGQCGDGINQCAAMGVTCRQVNMPRPEVCDGYDNDCNGMTDEGEGLCAGRQVCDRGSCVDRCEPELGCLPGRTCLTTGPGICVETACIDVTCPAGERCLGGMCVGVCSGVTCPHSQICRAGRCVDPCQGVRCDAREICVDGTCVPECQCRPCAEGQMCQPDGRCVTEPCVGVSCPEGTWCDRGTCRDSCEAPPDTRLCPGGEYCQLGQCTPGRDPTVRDGGTTTDGSTTDGSTTEDTGTPAGDTGVLPGDVLTRDTGARDGTFVPLLPGNRTGCACRVGVGADEGVDGRLALAAAALGLALVARRRRRA